MAACSEVQSCRVCKTNSSCLHNAEDSCGNEQIKDILRVILNLEVGSGEPAFKVCCNCLKTTVDAYNLRRFTQDFDSIVSVNDDSNPTPPMEREAYDPSEGGFSSSAGSMPYELTTYHSAPPFYYPTYVPCQDHSAASQRVPVQEKRKRESSELGSQIHENWTDSSDYHFDNSSDTVCDSSSEESRYYDFDEDSSLDLQSNQASRIIHMRPSATSSHRNLFQELEQEIDPASFLENQVSEVTQDEEDDDEITHYEEDDDEIAYAIYFGP